MSSAVPAAHVPAACGTAIPSSPDDLLSFIKTNKHKKKSNKHASAASSAGDLSHSAEVHGHHDRHKKLEEDREAYEVKLMSLEDFVFTAEGAERLKRAEDRLLMETEDSKSILLKEIFKDYDKQRFRDQVRREVELRKAQELAEKEERRRAAEVRRAAVVERIRQQQEAEERRKREAEEAVRRIEEERLRRLQEEADRLLADQAQMSLEDQLSALAEQDLKDQQERRLWMQREREKLAEWERQQKEKDLLEEEQRKARLAELEEKRKKLEQLRLLQQSKPADDSKLREEGDRLNKQLRIQTRAKFVSKKISHTAAAVPETGEHIAPAPSVVPAGPAPSPAPGPETAVLHRQASRHTLDAVIFQQDGAETKPPASTAPPPPTAAAVSPALADFLGRVASSHSEAELRSWQQEVMAEKRALRLEQRQRASFQMVDEASSLDVQLAELTAKGEAIGRRIEALLEASAASKMDGVRGAGGDGLPTDTLSSTTATAPVPVTDTPPPQEHPETAVFKRVETALRETHRWLHQLQQAKESGGGGEACIRALTLLSLEMQQLGKEVRAGHDPLGYEDKLQAASQQIAAGLQAAESTVSSSSRPSSRTARPPSAPARAFPTAESIAAPTAESAVLSSASSPALPIALVDDVLHGEEGEEDEEEEEDEGEEGGGGGGEGEDREDPSSLPGWEECLYTSMFSAAHHAAYFGFVDVLRFLCKHFDCFIMDKKGRTPLFYGALANRLDCVAELVGLDPQWIDVGDAKGDTPLHAAAISDGVQVLAFLLSCEVHPDTANYQGLTPSHLARSSEALHILQQAGAQMFCVDNQSRTPLWFACCEGRVECVDFLCTVTPTEFLLWPDHEGETCLHKAAGQGHAAVVEVLCRCLPTIEDLYVLNKKQHTACHVAANARVLQVLYEQGANLWVKDGKDRVPLFFASFFGRADCVEMLINLAVSTTKTLSRPPSRIPSRPVSAAGMAANGKTSTSTSSPVAAGEVPGLIVPDLLRSRDSQGDTALHAACLCGHLPCVALLSYFLRDEENRGKLRASDLAKKAGHLHIARYVDIMETYRRQGLSNKVVFGEGVDFATYASFITYYGSRWTKAYDAQFQTTYYLDRLTNASQWEKPELFDMSAEDEAKYDKALELLYWFYSQYNPDKLSDLHNILLAYRHRYTELFISLANKYDVQDLSMFAGVTFD